MKYDPWKSMYFCPWLKVLIVKKSLNAVSTSLLEWNIFSIKSIQMLEKNGIQWVRYQKNMLDVAKSYIPNQSASAGSPWQHVTEHCHEEKLWPNLNSCTKSKCITSFFLLIIRGIGIMVRVFTNGVWNQGSITGWVIQKTKKNGTWCRLA